LEKKALEGYSMSMSYDTSVLQDETLEKWMESEGVKICEALARFR